MRGNWAVCTVVLFAGPIALAQTPSLHWIGTSLRGIDGSSVCSGVSPDGQVAVGRFKRADAPYAEEGITWRQGTGMAGLGDLPGDAFVREATAASNAGEVLVGAGLGSWDQYHAVYATAAGVVDLEGPGEVHTRSIAWDVSADGTVIVGLRDTGPNRAFRWTAEQGMVLLGELENSATAVSHDGLTVVGATASAHSNQEAFRWRAETGMVVLGFFPGEGISTAVDTSADGTVVVGHGSRHIAGYTSTFTEAFVWTEEGGMVGLGTLADPPTQVLLSEAKGVSADGTVVIGLTYTTAGERVPFVWDATHGMRSLEDVFVNESGFDLSGCTLKAAMGISGDGQVIVGWGVTPNGKEGWVAVIPEPATLALLALGGLAFLRRCPGRVLRRRRGTPARPTGARRRPWLISLGLTLLAASGSAQAGTPRVYWADNDADNINRIWADGTGAETLLSTQPVPLGLAIDAEAGKMYWTDNGVSWDTTARGRICRANLNGSDPEVLYTTARGQNDGAGDVLLQLTLDVSARVIYFRENRGGIGDRVARMNYDASDVQTVLLDNALTMGLELDPVAGHLYFTSRPGPIIERCSLDGSGRETVVAAYAYSFSLDLDNQVIYGADSAESRIFRVGMDGTGMTDVITAVGSPRDVQRYGDHLYYTDVVVAWEEGPISVYARVLRANLDGSDLFVLQQKDRYQTPSDPIQLAVIPEPVTLSLLGLGVLALLRRRRRK